MNAEVTEAPEIARVPRQVDLLQARPPEGSLLDDLLRTL